MITESVLGLISDVCLEYGNGNGCVYAPSFVGVPVAGFRFEA